MMMIEWVDIHERDPLILESTLPYWIIDPLASEREGHRVFFKDWVPIGPRFTHFKAFARIFGSYRRALECIAEFPMMASGVPEVACMCANNAKSLCVSCRDEYDRLATVDDCGQ